MQKSNALPPASAQLSWLFSPSPLFTSRVQFSLPYRFSLQKHEFKYIVKAPVFNYRERPIVSKKVSIVYI